MALEGLTKVYGQGHPPALDDINLRLEAGHFTTILGPSGSGKTTMLKLIAGFEAPSAGRIFVGDVDITGAAPAARSIGMVFQHYALFPHMSVARNIGYGLKMRRWAKRAIAERVEEMVKLVRLDGMADRMPTQLSGGQQQRVAIARALAFRPHLLLMDEPLGALDRELRIDMAEELRRIHRETGITVVYVTHDREEALTLSDRIVVLRRGHVVANDTAEDLYSNPRDTFAATFFGGHNVLPATCVEARGERAVVEWNGQRIDVAAPGDLVAGRPCGLVLPRRALRIDGAAEAVDGLTIDATVVETLFMGDVVHVRVALASGEVLIAAVDGHDSSALAVNEPCRLVARVPQLRAVRPIDG